MIWVLEVLQLKYHHPKVNLNIYLLCYLNKINIIYCTKIDWYLDLIIKNNYYHEADTID